MKIILIAIVAISIVLFVMISCNNLNEKNSVSGSIHMQKSKISVCDTIIVYKTIGNNDTIWSIIGSDSCILRIDTILYELPFDTINNVASIDSGSIPQDYNKATESCFGGELLNIKNDTFYMELKLVYIDPERGYNNTETRVFLCKKSDIYPFKHIYKNYYTDDRNEFIKQ